MPEITITPPSTKLLQTDPKTPVFATSNISFLISSTLKKTGAKVIPPTQISEAFVSKYNQLNLIPDVTISSVNGHLNFSSEILANELKEERNEINKNQEKKESESKKPKQVTEEEKYPKHELKVYFYLLILFVLFNLFSIKNKQANKTTTKYH